MLERGTETAKREAREQVPTDRVRDAPALARELRWRIRVACGYDSDGEHEGNERARSKSEGRDLPVTGVKRKVSDTAAVGDLEDRPAFKHFRPKTWEGRSVINEDQQRHVSAAQTPSRPPLEQVADEQWVGPWLEWRHEDVGKGAGEGEQDEQSGENSREDEVEVRRRREVVIQVRRTAHGLERQRVDRVVEQWDWDVPRTESSSAKTDVAPDDVVMKTEVH